MKNKEKTIEQILELKKQAESEIEAILRDLSDKVFPMEVKEIHSHHIITDQDNYCEYPSLRVELSL